METTKPLWMSKTVWMGFLTALIAFLNAFGIILPPVITETVIGEIVVGALGILTIVFRHQADSKTTILPVTPTA
jgi:hypothetical protein